MPRGVYRPMGDAPGQFNREMGTGYMTREFIWTKKTATQMECWRYVKYRCEQLGVQYPTWDSYRNFFSRLKRAGLVRLDRRVPDQDLTGNIRSRSFYSIVRENYNNPAWNNVQRALYPNTPTGAGAMTGERINRLEENARYARRTSQR